MCTVSWGICPNIYYPSLQFHGGRGCSSPIHLPFPNENIQAMGLTGPTIILGSDVLKLGKGAMIISFFSKKIWLAL